MSDDAHTPRIAPFGLRMPPDLKERVSKAAEAANRSMNAEIVATLEEKYPAPKLSAEGVVAIIREAVEALRTYQQGSFDIDVPVSMSPDEAAEFENHLDGIIERFEKARGTGLFP